MICDNIYYGRVVSRLNIFRDNRNVFENIFVKDKISCRTGKMTVLLKLISPLWPISEVGQWCKGASG